MKTVEIIKSIVEEKKNNSIDIVKRRYSKELSEQMATLKKEIIENGFAIVPSFLSKEECTAIMGWMDEIIDTNPKIWTDEIKSDNRIFFSNTANPSIDNFFHNPFVVDILSSYEKTDHYKGFTLANKVIYKEKNQGSGGGWHRDFVKRKQTKALVYLSEVGEQNGPFQYIKGSHKFSNILKLQREHGYKYNQHRFTDAEINPILKDNPELLFTITGAPGTMILVDTRGIHRGKPIEKQFRYALTNYYWFNAAIPSHIRKLNPFI